jgi:transcriptional regulator with XRE-family HTH domain
MQTESFGKTIRIARILKDLSQKDVADMVGITPGYLSNIERERVVCPATRVIMRLAEILELDFHRLLYISLENDPSAPEDIRDNFQDVAALLDESDIQAKLNKLLHINFLADELQAITLHFRTNRSSSSKDVSQDALKRVCYYRGPNGWDISWYSPGSSVGYRMRLMREQQRIEDENEQEETEPD